MHPRPDPLTRALRSALLLGSAATTLALILMAIRAAS